MKVGDYIDEKRIHHFSVGHFAAFSTNFTSFKKAQAFYEDEYKSAAKEAMDNDERPGWSLETYEYFASDCFQLSACDKTGNIIYRIEGGGVGEGTTDEEISNLYGPWGEEEEEED